MCRSSLAILCSFCSLVSYVGGCGNVRARQIYQSEREREREREVGKESGRERERERDGWVASDRRKEG